MTRKGLAITLLAGAAAPAAGQSPLWMHRFDSGATESADSVALDPAGHVFVTGYTSGSLGGPHAGLPDAFLAKCDASGVPLWIRQFGTIGDDRGEGVAIDGAGGAYIAGSADWSLTGPSTGTDTFLARYDATGTLLWIRQLGALSPQAASAVAVDSAGNAYITGYTYNSLGAPNAGSVDTFLVKYNGSGDVVWIRQFGSSELDYGLALATDHADNTYITGRTLGSLAGPNAGSNDAFLAKYDSAGNQLWLRQFGTPQTDWGSGVPTDPVGNVFVTGYTQGSLSAPNAGGGDTFLAKFDAAGTSVWIRQLGSAGGDSGTGVALDGTGNIYLTGYTSGAFGGPNAGSFDAFLAKCDAEGALLWVHQFGTTSIDEANGVAVDSTGNAYVAGKAPHPGQMWQWDAILAKYSAAPCPANCDGSTVSPILNVADFICFLGRYAAGDSYANCDGSTIPPVLSSADFICFQTQFAAGCP